MYVIDPDGKVAFWGTSAQAAEATIDKLLKEKPPKVAKSVATRHADERIGVRDFPGRRPGEQDAGRRRRHRGGDVLQMRQDVTSLPEGVAVGMLGHGVPKGDLPFEVLGIGVFERSHVKEELIGVGESGGEVRQLGPALDCP